METSPEHAGERTGPRSLGEIRTRLRAKLPALKERFDVKALSVFGSWTRGESDPGSPVKLLVRFEEKPVIFGYMALERRLSQVPRAPIDLGMLSKLRRMTHPGKELSGMDLEPTEPTA